jgi:hypothetical protein
MLAKFDAASILLLFPDAIPEEPSPVDARAAGSSADVPASQEHSAQMIFRLTADRRRVLVPVTSDTERREDL